MKAKEFEKFLRQLSRSSADMDQRLRRLREEGVLGTERGPHAPDIEIRQAVAVLLSLAPCRSVDGATVSLRAMGLPFVPRAGEAETGETLGDYLTRILADPHTVLAEKIDRLEIRENGSFARVVGEDGKAKIFIDDEKITKALRKPDTNHDAMGQSIGERRLFLSGGFLQQVALVVGDLQVRNFGWEKEEKW